MLNQNYHYPGNESFTITLIIKFNLIPVQKHVSQEWSTVCTLGDTNTLPKQMVTYLNVNIVYQQVYHLAD